MKYTYTFLLSLLSFTFAFAQNFCDTSVTHFNIAAETNSEIKLTIENSGADKITVSATGVASPIDVFFMGAPADGAPTATTTDITDGVASFDLSWAAGTMPATVSFELLWSTEAFGGNWMVTKGDAGDGLGNVDTSTTCPEAPESEKKYLHITVPGSDENTLVQITGPWWGWSGTDPANNPLPAGVRNADGTYTITFDPAFTSDMEFKVLKDGVQEDILTSYSSGACAANVANLNTDGANYANRWFKADDASDMYITFGDCSDLTFSTIDYIIESVNVYPNPVKNIATILASETIEMVRIYDLTGRMVKQANPNKSEFSLDVADLSKGAYLVKLNAGDNEATTKLIK